MTNDERRRAFDLRLKGMPWGEIAKEMNYSRYAVEEDIKKIVGGRRKTFRCIYPALRDEIISNHYNSVVTFALDCGISYETMYACLSGRSVPGAKLKKRICEATGLSEEEAFRREEDV